MDDLPGIDAFMRELVEYVAAGGFTGVPHRSADRGATAEADDSDGAIERVAATDFVEMAGVYLGAARRRALHPECQVTHGYADAEDARRDFRCGSVGRIHLGIRHVGAASCRNQGPEVID